MDIKQYIESGLLESYLLDALLPEEKAQVERDLADSKELRAALHQLEFEFEQLAYVLEKAPSTTVWEKIEKSVDDAQEKAKKAPIIEQELNSAPVFELPQTKEIKKESPKSDVTIWKYWSIAASVAALAFFYLWQITVSEKQKVSSELELVKQALQETNEEKKYFASMQEKLVNPAFSTIQLAAADPAKSFSAKVMWNKSSGEVLVATQEIPTLNADQDLQLWALVDGKPIDAGVISLDKNLPVTQQSIVIEKADMFAITIEPKGGRPEPTLTQLVLIGKTTP